MRQKYIHGDVTLIHNNKEFLNILRSDRIPGLSLFNGFGLGIGVKKAY